MGGQRKHEETQGMERRKRDEARDKKMLEITSAMSAISMRNFSSTIKVDSKVKAVDSTALPVSDSLARELNFHDFPASNTPCFALFPSARARFRRPSASNECKLSESRFLSTKDIPE